MFSFFYGVELTEQTGTSTRPSGAPVSGEFWTECYLAYRSWCRPFFDNPEFVAAMSAMRGEGSAV